MAALKVSSKAELKVVMLDDGWAAWTASYEVVMMDDGRAAWTASYGAVKLDDE